MKSATVMKIEPEPITTEITLILPTEKGRKRVHIREWICLRLIDLGFETVGVNEWVFGRFPERITIHPYVTDHIEERMGLLQGFCRVLNIRIVDPGEAVK